MKTLVVWIGLAVAACGQQPAMNQAATEWVTQSLKAMQPIKPGMMGADLLKVFTTEGGISTTRERTYVFRECPYIKVRVEFEVGGGREQPNDRIKTISKPYLEWAIAD